MTTNRKIGVIHPGEMGISVAVSAQKSGCTVYWAAQGRSAATVERAAQHGLFDAGEIGDLCALCSALVSVCPPHAAEDVADQVIAAGFRGLYLDANAIAPARSIQIGQRMERAGATFVDGGIIGGPAWKPQSTWLYLSGSRAEEAASFFVSGPLETKVLGEEIGAASALKMCYAAYTKGTTALLAAILAAAESYGVEEALAQQWEHDTPGFVAQTQQRVRQVTAKAWRFEGEMEEIAATMVTVGLPGGFHKAAADIYRRLAGFKGAPITPTLAETLAALHATGVIGRDQA
jgi:3-hydroxyisobutyrate dehydrogenase-like beta-hydroxyacid dehydrogenase